MKEVLDDSVKDVKGAKMLNRYLRGKWQRLVMETRT